MKEEFAFEIEKYGHWTHSPIREVFASSYPLPEVQSFTPAASMCPPSSTVVHPTSARCPPSSAVVYPASARQSGVRLRRGVGVLLRHCVKRPKYSYSNCLSLRWIFVHRREKHHPLLPRSRRKNSQKSLCRRVPRLQSSMQNLKSTGAAATRQRAFEFR